MVDIAGHNESFGETHRCCRRGWVIFLILLIVAISCFFRLNVAGPRVELAKAKILQAQCGMTPPTTHVHYYAANDAYSDVASHLVSSMEHLT